MDNIKISIITVCLNAEKTIERTISSVLSQTYNNIEFIIQDGYSNDHTKDIVSKYKDIYFYQEKDSGIYDAMNKAKAKATGDFLLFLGADDILDSNMVISNLVGKITDCDKIYYGNVVRTNSGQIYDGKFSKWHWGYKNICHQCIFYPASIYKKRDYELNYKLVADWVYNLRLMIDHIEFCYVDIVVSKYNDVDGISSTKVDHQFLKERRQLTINAVGLFPYLYGCFAKLLKKIL